MSENTLSRINSKLYIAKEQIENLYINKFENIYSKGNCKNRKKKKNRKNIEIKWREYQ